jgi:DNA-3-methyladenine glycosylase I
MANSNLSPALLRASAPSALASCVADKLAVTRPVNIRKNHKVVIIETRDKTPDPLLRCAWARTPLSIAYHDLEWGVPVHDDNILFEFLTLEGAQAGLSWETILKKRDAYREAFAGFEPTKVARFGLAQVARLLENPGIVRNRLKIASTVSNARAFLAVQREFGSFDSYVWGFVGGMPQTNRRRTPGQVPARTPQSDALSRDLLSRGFRFVGSTICYAFMQAVGMVNDHTMNCFRYERRPMERAMRKIPATKGTPRKRARSTATKNKRPAKPVLLSGGNPQIAKADGDDPVQAYIAAMPGWKRDAGRRLDALIVRTVPGVRKAVKWNSPFYGIEGQGWFLSFHTFTNYIKVTFFQGTSLRPVPAGGKAKEARWIDIHADDLDEAHMAKWIRQAAALPGWGTS